MCIETIEIITVDDDGKWLRLKSTMATWSEVDVTEMIPELYHRHPIIPVIARLRSSLRSKPTKKGVYTSSSCIQKIRYARIGGESKRTKTSESKRTTQESGEHRMTISPQSQQKPDEADVFNRLRTL
jgi:hypothetical protein